MTITPDCFSDAAIISYFVSVILSFYGFGLFVWWWKKVGNPSEVYVYVTLLLFSNGLSDLIALIVRFLLLAQSDLHQLFLQSWSWKLRRVPEVAVLFFLMVRMSWRVFQAYRHPVEDRRSGSDRRKF